MNKDANNLEKRYQLISEADFTLGPKDQGRDFDNVFFQQYRKKIIEALQEAVSAYADQVGEFADGDPESYPNADYLWSLIDWLYEPGVKEKLESLLDDQTILKIHNDQRDTGLDD